MKKIYLTFNLIIFNKYPYFTFAEGYKSYVSKFILLFCHDKIMPQLWEVFEWP